MPVNIARLLALVAVAALPGCSSHVAYPVEWGGLSSAGGDRCPSLSGVFRNAGEIALLEGDSPRYSSPHLSHYFFADAAAAARADHVRITGDANVGLTVALLGEEASLAPLTLQRQEDYRCEEGWLLMKSTHSVAEQVSGFEFVTYRFRKTNDGALVVRISSSGVGVIFVVPVAGSSTEWHRFLPAE